MKKKFECLFDTGSRDNYVTRKVVERIMCNTISLNDPIKRYTCLNEIFLVKDKVIIDFVYKNKNYREEFLIFPKRVDDGIILGTNWLKKVKSNKYIDKEEQIETIESLINLLCTKGDRKVENYECRIETIPGK
ncbi:hypothetical protein NGRA_3372 [Nosema granulosis]|uniref:Pol polyprotein n=1 Tax=Nosema granulosis TaxID=83296 RepID=A0A9P6KWU2_9MICR|nr:hypothetical protein NGRA_3372 [Nosema granulosis]